MPETITVRFGGREVVLRPVSKQSDAFWTSDALDLDRLGPNWFATCLGKLHGCASDVQGSSPQAAVTALEQKLIRLRDSINVILGERP